MNVIEEYIRKIKRKVEDTSDRLEKIEFALQWIGKVATDRDYIQVISESRVEFYYYPFPRKPGDLAQRIKSIPHDAPTFIVADIDRHWLPDGNFIIIFYSSRLSIYENRKRFQTNVPLRWGFSDQEKNEALSYARAILEQLLSTGSTNITEHLSKLSQRFFMQGDVEVAFWVRGQLRGAVVIERFWLYEGIARAVMSASNDFRFKPITKGDLNDLRIEISIISDCRIRLSEVEMLAQEITETRKAILMESDNKRGWFLPIIFNVREFATFQNLLQELAQTKLFTSFNSRKKNTSVYYAEVETFIDNIQRSGSNDIYGSIANIDRTVESSFTDMIVKGIDWLLSLMEPDGNLYVMVNPLSNTTRDFDLTRSAFTFAALAQFALHQKQSKYIPHIERHFRYLAHNIDNPLFSTDLLTICYGIQGALAVWQLTGNPAIFEISERWGVRVRNIKLPRNASPLFAQQAASALALLSSHNQDYFMEAKEFFEIAMRQFEASIKNSEVMNFAEYAELINTAYRLNLVRPDHAFHNSACIVIDWLMANKKKDNQAKFSEVWSATSHGGESYATGLGKILEALMLAPNFEKKYEAACLEALTKALEWFRIMQYGPENTYFLPRPISKRIVGSIRFSSTRTDAWIDVIGHLLLIYTRSSKWKL